MKKILLSLLAAIGLSTTGCSAQAAQHRLLNHQNQPHRMVSSYWLHRPLSTRQRQIQPASSSMSAPKRNMQKDIWLAPNNWITLIPRHSMPASVSLINPAPITSTAEADAEAMVPA